MKESCDDCRMVQLIFNINRILDEHKTVMKKFFKETTCTAVLRPVFLGVEQETGPDKVFSDQILFSNNVF